MRGFPPIATVATESTWSAAGPPNLAFLQTSPSTRFRDRDAAFIQIDHDGEVLATSEPDSRANSEIPRAQIFAAESDVAI